MENTLKTLRDHFPLYCNQENELPIIYFDNASTTLKPYSVIDKMTQFYHEYPFNVHRGAHQLAERSTREFEASRELVREFINAESDKEIIFTRGTTEAINLVASSFGETFVNEGDEIIITQMEHHANIVPWKMLCERKGAILKVIPITSEGVLDLEIFKNLLSAKTKLVAVVFVSNSLGTINPVRKIIDNAHHAGAKVLIDAAQAVAHFPIDVQTLDADFLCFSGHKMFGPFGVGVLYGKKELLESMSPYQGGGGMISNVSFDSISFAALPNKFEAGTPPICSVIALGEAIRFIKRIGFNTIMTLEHDLALYFKEKLQSIQNVRLIGNAVIRCSVFSLWIEGIHPHDINTLLDQRRIAIRSGHHCSQPVMDHYKIPASSRVSLSFYNTKNEIDLFAQTIEEMGEIFL